jgi:hypothetical protein
MKSRHYNDNFKKSLQQEFEQLKQEDALLQPSAELQNKLLEAFRSGAIRSSVNANFWLQAAAVFLLAVICGSLWILKPELRKNESAQTIPVIDQSSNGYVPLTYGMTPEESLQRVRVKLPRSALDDFGITINAIRSEEVTADVLVGESGLPYAIRVVQKN